MAAEPDYTRITGRFAFKTADSADAGDTPDTIFAGTGATITIEHRRERVQLVDVPAGEKPTTYFTRPVVLTLDTDGDVVLQGQEYARCST